MALLALPTAIAFSVLLRPWAAGLDPADFSTAEGVAAVPVVAALLAVVAVAYRPLLATPIVERRGVEEVRLGSTYLGLAVWSSPVVVGLFAPLFGGGQFVPTLAIGLAVGAAEICVLERQRRGCNTRPLRWADPALERYRLRWMATIPAVAVLGALASLDVTSEGPSQAAGFAAFAIPLAAMSPFWLAISAFTEDEQLGIRQRVAGALPGILLLALPVLAVMAWGADTKSLIVGTAATIVLVPLLERSRRRAIATHVERIVAEGHGDRLAGSYPGLV